MANPKALAKFTPGTVVGGAGSGEARVSIKTNLAGEAIRFSFSETLGNIVSSGSLTLLNAKLDELDDVQVGAIGVDKTYTPAEIADYLDDIAEEDAAQWGTVQPDATVEPNQLVEVTEIVGTFTSNLDPDTGLTTYTAGEGADMETTYWRVVSFVAYVDDDGVPYCDVTLESLAQVAIDAKVSPEKLGASQDDCALFVSNVSVGGGAGYWDSIKYFEQKNVVDIDGYTIDDSVALANPELDSARIIINDAGQYLTPFVDAIKESGVFVFTGDLPNITRIPLAKEFKKGTSVWQTIEDILGLNKKSARFTRAKELISWDTDSSDAPLGSSDIGEFGTGLKVSYGKEGVFNTAVVTGYLGVVDPASGYWVPKANKVTEVKVTSTAAQNILNTTEEIPQTFEVSPDWLFESDDDLKAWGQKELYKAVMSARGATADSKGYPLSVEVGMRLMGTSQVAGTLAILVTSYSRSTDAQQRTVTHNIGGTILSIVSTDAEGWLE